ncbi:hypothetical protein E2P81_ATG07193 [Venturia nashicola]|uniref:Uncharacterized protein n=1 Tax=Venturia nashicola TaxID=86259 RepID=A0A4Z1PDE7_9PEZI|nr:hypothetical protein E6O75_ATG07356 [Venturia nashicola]TLD31703.1 hypothetical protein E2P81_ATG07193 [Venturia nashicola]
MLSKPLATFTRGSPLSPRDAGTSLLITDLLNLDLEIQNITKAANAHTGGPAAYQPIRDSFVRVNRTNRIAYYDVNSRRICSFSGRLRKERDELLSMDMYSRISRSIWPYCRTHRSIQISTHSVTPS